MGNRVRRVRVASVGAVLLSMVASAPALGTVFDFDFSYAYDDGKMLTGSFRGDTNGNAIESITNLEASYEGTSLGNLQIEWDLASFSGATMHLEGNGFVMGLPSGFSLATGLPDVVVEQGVIVQPPVLPGSSLIFVPSRWYVVIPDGAMDLVVPAEVTIGTLGASGVFSTSWGWIVATNQTVTVADLDALDTDGFESTIDDPQVTPSPTYLLNTALIGPLDPLEVGGRTSSEFQALLVPGETLVQPNVSFMQYGFNFPSGHVSSATATITATFENCVATYDTTVNFVAISSPRLVVNSAQRVPILCPPPPVPVPALKGWSLGTLGLLLVGVGLWRLARE